MHSGWPLQLITEHAPGMGKARSLLPASLTRQPSSEYASDGDAYLEPSETRSDLSQFFDAHSDGESNCPWYSQATSITMSY